MTTEPDTVLADILRRLIAEDWWDVALNDDGSYWLRIDSSTTLTPTEAAALATITNEPLETPAERDARRRQSRADMLNRLGLTPPESA